jgi:hypothetical protein
MVLAGLVLFIALCRDSNGPGHLAAMRARVAVLEANQAAAREVVRRAEARWPDDPDRMWAESRSARWLTAEEWAELLELRERLGPPLVAESDGWRGGPINCSDPER